MLGRLDTFLRQFTPIIDYLGLYKREIAAFFANDSAVTEARQGNLPHYLRTQNPVNPEIMAAYPNRLATNRSNPYPRAGRLQQARQPEAPRRRSGATCAPRTPCRPARRPPRARPAHVVVLDYYAFGGTKNRGAAPPCTPQAPLGPQTNGGPGVYPRLQPLP